MPSAPVNRFKEVNLAQLRSFCECVRQGSFAAAARALHLSQPAVWQQVRALERLAGVPLLERQGRILRLTADGRIFWEQAHAVLGNVESLWATFDERRQALPRIVTVLATPAVLSEELAPAVVAFRAAYPEIELRLQSQHGLPILDQLTRGDADLAVVPADVLAGADLAQFNREQLGHRPATLVVAESHPFARDSVPDWEDLVREPLILPLEDNSWFVQVLEVLRTQGYAERLRAVVRVNHILAAQTFVGYGLGPALMPMPGPGRPPPGLAYCRLDHLLPGLPIYLLSRRGVALRPHAERFVEVLRANWSAC